jgi:hypothetical protein
MEPTDVNFTDKLIKGLKNAATELEELQVQVALGKAEAKDLFEDLKKKFNARLNVLKSDLSKIKTNKNILPVINALERLQVQLALGLAETKELFEDQIKKIHIELCVLESELKNSEPLNGHATEMQLEIEKFKAKVELVSLRFKLKKMISGSNFEQKKMEFHHKMDELKAKISEKENQAKNKWNFFKKEIDEAYAHLKSAFIQ